MNTTYKPSEKLKKLLLANNIEPDTIDFGSYSNDIPVLDYIKNEYGYVLRTMKELKENTKGSIEKAQLEEFSKNASLVKQYNSRQLESSKEVEEFFKPIKRAITKLVSGYTNFVIIKGRAGIGKSYQIERYLKELNAPYKEVTYISEAYLYRILYENKEGIIWFKDFNNLLRSLKGIDELKAATETNEHRLITNYNYSDYQTDIPKEFIFKGKIIIDCNSIIPNFKEDMEALISRAGNNYIDFNLSYDEIRSLMLKLCKETWQQEVTQFLFNCYEFVGLNELNLRTQFHSFKTYEYCLSAKLDWKTELKEELKNNRSKIRSIIYSVAGNSAIKVMDLKKYLIRSGFCGTLRTASRRIEEWEVLEEIYKVSTNEYNYFVSLNPIEIGTIGT